MKLPASNSRVARRCAAFTMVEIAISLGVIAFALVAIIGVLPRGMNVQRDNREETIINQEAAVFAEAIRSGIPANMLANVVMNGPYDDLTNHVYAITNYWGRFEVISNSPTAFVTNFLSSGTNGYVYDRSDVQAISPRLPPPGLPIWNGLRIVGLLGQPKYESLGGLRFQSNHVVAFVRAMSGVAAEKSPQDNADVRADAFSYRMICENQPMPLLFDPSTPPTSSPDYARYTNYTSYLRQLTNNLSELRLTFRWPLSARGVPGNGRQTFRMAVGGSLVQTNDPFITAHRLYFFSPSTFVKAAP